MENTQSNHLAKLKMGGYKRTALLVGCTYPGTQSELHGCINDVQSMRKTLIERFGFDPDRITLLTDAPDSDVMPTGANIKEALSRMVDEAEPGDVLFFHYSGHGTRYQHSKHGRHHTNDEAIVPCDFNLVTDMDIRALVNKLPEEATFTFLSDSCHSGGLLDKEKEQIGPHDSPSSEQKSSAAAAPHHRRHRHHHHHHRKPKGIPIESAIKHLSSISGVESDDIGTHLVTSFGDEVSLKFQEGDLEHHATKEIHPDTGILLSGCQANELSLDCRVPDEEGGVEAFGAYTNAVQQVLKEHKGPISNKELVAKVRALLMDEEMDQHPCLYCSDENADAPFLSQPEAA